MAALKWRWWVLGAVVLGCAGDRSGRSAAGSERRAQAAPPASAPPAAAPKGSSGPVALVQPEPGIAGANDGASARFEAFLSEHRDLEYRDLLSRLRISQVKETALPFDPTTVKYFDLIEPRLKLTREEREVFRKQGVVSIDHRQRHSMGSAYHAIYTQDLPVLITTDSILHALHRSFDDSLLQLEERVFLPVLDSVLEKSSSALARAARANRSPALQQSFEDVDLYFTVARNLLAGSGAPDHPGPHVIAPQVAAPELVRELLEKVSALAPEASTALYGGSRSIDWSQFSPRGHYTKSPELGRYFRAMMWLGRADLGFQLSAPERGAGVATGLLREQRDAALCVLSMQQSGELARLDQMSRTVDFLVGRADNVTIDQLRSILGKANIARPEQLAEPAALARFDTAARALGAGAQQIRSQALVADASPTPSPLPLVFQVFGQRFLIDSFVLSRVVYDSIVFKNDKQLRLMPSGLDVMAALGNDTAVRLLSPELERFKYSSNLLAARRVVEAMTAEDWRASVYNQWLSALRTLDDPAEPNSFFPALMKREAWRRKQLRTALSSWTELRHDTLLYGKQSYSSTLCEYPAGFVEPYPEFFRRLRELTATLSTRFRAVEPSGKKAERAPRVELRDGLAAFFARFAQTMQRLEGLAALELAGKPFSTADQDFLKKTIDKRGMGSGPPRYDGWYPDLILKGPELWDPVVADVHTDPNSQEVLYEAVGDVEFLVVAVDNGPHRAAYVGPAYSYFEFKRAGKRMTDEEWQQQIWDNQLPPPPGFTRMFQVPGVQRRLDQRAH